MSIDSQAHTSVRATLWRRVVADARKGLDGTMADVTQAQADMIVMAVHDRNVFQRLHLTGTAVDVVRDAHIPVLLVRVQEREQSARTAVPAYSESERT